MPPIKRRTLGKRRSALGPDDLHVRDSLNLHGGFAPSVIKPCDKLQTLDDFRDFWEANRELMQTMIVDPMRRELYHLLRHEPGTRTWCEFYFDLLPDDPRRQVEPDADPKQATIPPYRVPWQSVGGYESSFVYLRRRGLLKPGEVELMRTYHRHLLDHELHCHRSDMVSQHHEIRARDMATIVEIFDPRRQLELLTRDELEAAAPYLEAEA